MSSAAVMMMCISIVLVWGGLALASWHLWRHPEGDDVDEQ